LFVVPALVCAQPAGYKFPKDSADRNPFARNPVIMHEQELMILTDNITASLNSNPVQHRIYNLSPAPSLIPGASYYSTVLNEGNRHMYSSAGDFMGDEAEEVVAAWQTGQDIFISLPTIDQLSFTIGAAVTSYTLPGPLAAGTGGGNTGRIILRPCDLDGDGKDEFVTAYRNVSDSLIHLDVFDVDSLTGNIQLAGSIADESLYVLNANAYESFDLVTDDLDYNGVDELILVGTQESTINQHLFCKVYIVSGSGVSFTITPKAKSIFESDIVKTKIVYIKATTGDFNGDLLSEVAVSYNYKLDNYPSPDPDTFIKVLMAADSTATNPFQPDYTETLIVSNELYTTNQNVNNLYNFSMDAADIDADGHDEIVVSYDGGATRVLKAEDDMHFVLMTNIGNSYANAANPLYDNYMSVSDMNRDGFYDIVNVANYIDQSGIPFVQKLSINIQTWDTATSNFITLVSVNNLEPVNESNGGFERQFTIALGDFDLDRIRFGPPRKFIYSQMKHPLVILNSPPVHFDTLVGGVITDVAGVYPSPPVNPNFSASYSTLTANSLTLQTVENSDWAVSLELQLKDSIFGTGIEINTKSKYGQKFSNTQSSLQTVTVSSLNTAYTDDLIYGWITDYLIHEYPVIIDDSLAGYITSFVPVNGQKTWFGGTDQLGYEVILNHEPGNILSYPDYTSLIQDPDIKEGIKADFGNTYSVGPSSNFQWGMVFTDINTAITDTTESGTLEASGAAGAIKLSGEYNLSAQSTFTNTIQSDIKFDITMGPLAGGIPDANYRINPYLIWTRDGTVSLNYSVHPETPATGFPNTWWWQNYQIQDPGLLLPWRLFPEMGFPLLDQSKRTLSKSMWLSPRNPAPGDTVDIYTRVHNFSVSPTAAPVEVSFYLGDPAAGGVLLTSTTGQTSVFTSAALDKQGRSTVKFTWVAPQGILPDPRIFAWVDPLNTMTENNENNNRGWIPLGVNYPVGINDNLQQTSYTETVFPNPASERAMVNLMSASAGNIHVELFNLTGMKVKDFGEAYHPAGELYIPLELNGLASGLYICRVSMPSGNLQMKLVINKPED